MDEAELREFVVQRLAQGAPPKDVVLAVCERSGLTWEKAERLVLETASEQELVIANRQIPLLAILSATSMVVGIGLVIWFAKAMVEPFLMARPARGTPGLLEIAALIMWIASNAYFIGDVVLGAAMIAGGYLGLRKAGIRPFGR